MPYIDLRIFFDDPEQEEALRSNLHDALEDPYMIPQQPLEVQELAHVLLIENAHALAQRIKAAALAAEPTAYQWYIDDLVIDCDADNFWQLVTDTLDTAQQDNGPLTAAALNKLKVEPGNRVCFQFHGRLTMDQADTISERITEVLHLPEGCPVIVTDDTGEIYTIKEKEPS